MAFELKYEQRHLGPRSFFACILAIELFAILAIDMYVPALPSMQRSFDVSVGYLNLTMFAFFFVSAFSTFLAGPASDCFGRKPFLVGCTALFALSSIACAVAPTVEMLVAFRVCQGVGVGGIQTLATALIQDAYDDDSVQTAMTFLQSLVIIGPVLAPFLGTFVLLFTDWQGIFGMLAACGVVAFALSLLVGETHKVGGSASGALGKRVGAVLDISSVREGAGVGGVGNAGNVGNVGGAGKAGAAGASGNTGASGAAGACSAAPAIAHSECEVVSAGGVGDAGVVLGEVAGWHAGFGLADMARKVSGDCRTLLRGRSFTSLALIMGIAGMPFFAFIAAVSYILIDFFAMDYLGYSVIYALSCLTNCVAPFVYMALSKRFGYKRILRICFCLIAVSAACMLAVGSWTPALFFIAFVPYALAEGVIRPLSYVELLDQPEDRVGSASALVNFSYVLITAVATVVATLDWPTLVFGLGVITAATAAIMIALYAWGQRD